MPLLSRTSMEAASSALVLAFIIFAIGMSAAFVSGAAALIGILLRTSNCCWPISADLRCHELFNFLAIPLFIFAGALLAEGGIAKNLMDLASNTIGRGRGGLGVSVVASTMLSRAFRAHLPRIRRRSASAA